MQNKVKQMLAAMVKLKMMSTMQTPKVTSILERMVLLRRERLMM